MINVLFVCLGNICRSPMAEFILKQMILEDNLEDKIYVESCATSQEEIGNDIYYAAKEELDKNGINYQQRAARQLTKEDYDKFDYIIGFEVDNIRGIRRIIGLDPDNKVKRLLDFSTHPADILDPWYTRNFDLAYMEIKDGCNLLLKEIKRNM